MAQLSIEGGTVLTGDAAQPLLDPGHVITDGDRIAAVGRGSAPSLPGVERIDARDKLVIPGFVNAHTHLCMTLGRSLGTDRTLLQWLSQAQLPFMAQMLPEDYALAATLGAVENLRAGNTTVCEVFFSTRYGEGADALAANAIAEAGIRGVFFRCSNDEEFAPGFVESTAEIASRTRKLVDAWSGHERLRIGIGPLVPWTATEEYWADTVALARDRNLAVHLHTAETPEYNDLVQARTGRRNVPHLAAMGALGERVMLNHCIHLTDDEIELIAGHGSPVIHDPTSNMILASGTAPILKMRRAGIVIGLACDGPACNNTQDMFEVMKDAALLHKVTTRDAQALTAADVFAMATAGGAQACGLGDQVGALQKGRLADVVLVDTAASHLRPIHDPLATLVYSARAGDVDTVIVGGRVVVRGRKLLTIDEPALLRRAQARAQALRVTAGL
ncbi:MAG: amidohydrolase family protein [Candidatus Binatia bacterium]